MLLRTTQRDLQRSTSPLCPYFSLYTYFPLRGFQPSTSSTRVYVLFSFSEEFSSFIAPSYYSQQQSCFTSQQDLGSDCSYYKLTSSTVARIRSPNLLRVSDPLLLRSDYRSLEQGGSEGIGLARSQPLAVTFSSIIISLRGINISILVVGDSVAGVLLGCECSTKSTFNDRIILPFALRRRQILLPSQPISLHFIAFGSINFFQ